MQEGVESVQAYPHQSQGEPLVSPRGAEAGDPGGRWKAHAVSLVPGASCLQLAQTQLCHGQDAR